MRAASPYRLRSSWRMFALQPGTSMQVPVNAWRVTLYAVPNDLTAYIDGVEIIALFRDKSTTAQAGRLRFGGLRDHDGRAVYVNQTITLVCEDRVRFTIQEEYLDTDSAPNA